MPTHNNIPNIPTEVDVLIVGLGPVGSALGLQLAKAASKPKVLAIERFPDPYPLPRAVSLDGEGTRIVDFTAGIEGIGEKEETGQYVWINNLEQKELLLHIPPGPDGGLMFSQPFLEKHLLRSAPQYSNLFHGWGLELVSLTDHGNYVTSTVRSFADPAKPEQKPGETFEIKAKFVVGCDGANSKVRELLGISMNDLGYFFDWLIVDIILDQPRVYDPMNLQICDPRRPTTVVSGGSQRRRRWEFMALPTDPPGYLNQPSTAWELLKPFDVHPGNAKLEKSAVYRFQAKWGAEWGRNRVWLAGDAAHLMPPFAGQGLCSGLRDARNLSFKLLHLLSHPFLNPHNLLSTYSSERSFHIQYAIHFSIDLGKVICITDPILAAERDNRMSGKKGDPRLVLPPPRPQVLGPGLLADEGGEAALTNGVGRYVSNSVVSKDGITGKIDEIVGLGWVLLGLGVPVELKGRHAEVWKKLGGKSASLVSKKEKPGPGQLVDVNNGFHNSVAFLRKGAKYIVIRPDWYSFGLADDEQELGRVMNKLDEMMFQGQSDSKL